MARHDTQPAAVTPDLGEAIKSFPVRRQVRHCGEAFAVSPFDIYADCPWVHASFDVHGHHYQLTHMDAATNPRPTTYSTRPYGRVGAFFTAEVPPDKPLHLLYRLDLWEGAAPAGDDVAAAYESFIKPVQLRQ